MYLEYLATRCGLQMLNPIFITAYRKITETKKRVLTQQVMVPFLAFLLFLWNHIECSFCVVEESEEETCYCNVRRIN